MRITLRLHSDDRLRRPPVKRITLAVREGDGVSNEVSEVARRAAE